MKRLGVNAGLLCQFWKAYRRIDEIGQNLALQRSFATESASQKL
jgi:hypothetical protein